MMRLLPVLLLRSALLVALSASAALVVDYANAGDPAFCGIASGCFTVRRTAYAYLFGLIQLPYLGVAAFTTLFALALIAKNRVVYGAIAGLASFGALYAMYLLYLQHSVIGALCPWCVAVDTSAIVAAGSALWVLRLAMKDEALVALPSHPRVGWAWTIAATLGIMTPFVWAKFPKDPPMPAAIQREQAPDQLTIVSFTDFQCPFCRRLHPELHKVVEEGQGRRRLVRKMVPLPGHPGADPAALVYVCTPEPLREAVAEKLYTASADKLTPTGAIILATEAGADAFALSTCVKAPETREKIDADMKLFEELSGPGLPFTFVGKRIVIGANVDGLKDAVERELSGAHMSLPVWMMFVLIGGAFVTAIGVTITSASKQSA